MPIHKKSVLVVDDNDTTANILTRTFEMLGYDVWTKYDGLSAYNCIQEVVPDVAVIDLLLPGIDGVTLIAKIKNNPDTEHTRVYALSAGNRRELEPQATAAGCDGYIAKPFLPTEIRDLFG